MQLEQWISLRDIEINVKVSEGHFKEKVNKYIYDGHSLYRLQLVE
jgi:hypothetical protein